MYIIVYVVWFNTKIKKNQKQLKFFKMGQIVLDIKLNWIVLIYSKKINYLKQWLVKVAKAINDCC